ncbi:hypothetical protein L6452_42401 [Arctium lappa]|uniref:Uncharacterized protein n=1 Tax=Arctium lappa TaxID=4217 RepID=A0ACB8XI37_ARCLA|nr:hypothetical protein L6452_42401 [Arctium lappa]
MGAEAASTPASTEEDSAGVEVGQLLPSTPSFDRHTYRAPLSVTRTRERQVAVEQEHVDIPEDADDDDVDDVDYGPEEERTQQPIDD